MKVIKTIIKWIFIIFLFPLSLLFVAYFKQKKMNKELYNSREEIEDEVY